MVVVVRDRSLTWALFAVLAVILVIVAIVLLLITGGRGTVLVVAIPGFPIESIVIGLMFGLLLLVLKRMSTALC